MASEGEDPRLVFLGGVGEIGRNMAALELDGRILILDAGLSFPEAEMPGIDLVLPDFQYLRERPGRVEAPDGDGLPISVARLPGAAAAPPGLGRPTLSSTEPPRGAGGRGVRGVCSLRACGGSALARTTGWLVACCVSADGQSFQPTSGAASAPRPSVPATRPAAIVPAKRRSPRAVGRAARGFME